ncbi:LacI family DNA-binding transcriptional regulator [Psychrosphaera ytuae]|uniref:LacI family DNA-binding transcriptional regulator n=1 Tax=Psychrosphaera ytuae TaxID=2820710 RepID=A0A975DDF3_9GAMM|nr:LacI family DNA-binding transcriptional regulator [Psychrosphaera ytuae]QTH64838.1 LacI family DNA-binding transcriptional regulator [Psychrosphaera ytuae]
MTEKKWTLKSIAAELGVSNATVSNAFNRPDQLSEKRRREILEACERLGYSGPNRAAQSLRKGKFNIVALVLPDSIEYMVSDPVASQFVRGVSAVLEPNGINILLFSGQADSINTISDFVDGFICYGTPRNSKLIEQLKLTKKKVVTVDFDIARNASVNVENLQACAELARQVITPDDNHVAVLGLRLLDSDQVSIIKCQLSDLNTTAISHQRLLGYQQALQANDITLTGDTVWNIPESNEKYASVAARQALLSSPRPSILLCMSDLIAIAAIKEAEKLGLRVPEDIKITGFDGIDEALRSNPSVTTVHQNSEEKGKKAAELFIAQATHAETIPFEIVRGKSG